MNKNISKDVCKNIIGTYKRVSNIIEQELKNKKQNIIGQPESFLFNCEQVWVLYLFNLFPFSNFISFLIKGVLCLKGLLYF